MKSRKPAEARPLMRTSATHEPSLGRDVQAKIGQQLRTMFDEVVKQGVPDRFIDLLGRLEHEDDKKS